jgi:hypothetical protein
MKLVRLFLCVMAFLAFAPTQASAETHSKLNQPTVQASSVHHSTTPDTTPLAPLGMSLVGVALMGATKKVTLGKTYLFEGDSYGPGRDISVPENFPEIDGDTGDVIHEEGSPAARNAARARSFSSAPNTGGVNTGENQSGDASGGKPRTVSGMTAAELEKKNVADLENLAVELGVPVERGDGKDGDPVKADYVAALSAEA